MCALGDDAVPGRLLGEVCAARGDRAGCVPWALGLPGEERPWLLLRPTCSQLAAPGCGSSGGCKGSASSANKISLGKYENSVCHVASTVAVKIDYRLTRLAPVSLPSPN
jgi:hypothetical protein